MGWRSQLWREVKRQRSQRSGRVGVMGTGECFHFARAVGGTLMQAVTLFNKMPRKARGQEEGQEGDTVAGAGRRLS